MLILEGKSLSQKLLTQLGQEVQRLTNLGVIPHIALLLVGDNPASQSYIRAKSKACKEVGIRSTVLHIPSQTSLSDVLDIIEKWNSDPDIHGILVQLPLPPHIDAAEVLLAIDPRKDVDGFHPFNAGRLMLGMPCFVPCTPAGIVELLRNYRIEVSGKHVVIVGRSNIVGRPLANLLSLKAPWADAVVTICHSGAGDLRQYTLFADVLVVAVGRPKLIGADDVRNGVVIVDVGINRLPDTSKPQGYQLIGDVDFEGVASKVSAITPVPGGVGPMTITMLLRNTIYSASGEIWQRPMFQ